MADQSMPLDGPRGSSRDELVLLALGGIGEIGMNCYLYGLGPADARQWLMVDLGLTFPEGENDPGVDVILPDLRYIEAEHGSLAGLLLTHAHEDHFGAVIELWPRLRVPIYATPFTAALLRAKVAEFGKRRELPIREVALGSRFNIGPFALELVEMAHSIPESNALLLRTPQGTVLHTGDWKLDPTPVIGGFVSTSRLAEIGTEGITALVCDSTNAMREGRSPSEQDVARSLADIIARAKRRVVVTIFASNVARIRAVWEAARASGRHLVVAGRAMHRIIDVAMATGYLPADFDYDDQSRFPHLRAEEVVALCTGSQGEQRAAIARIAADEHPDIELDHGDLVIFSSRTIPGNERAVGQIQNRLVDIGCEVITDADALVHVTGHPRRDELIEMYAAVKPRIAVPMHGEPRHLEAHRKLARAAGVKEVLSIRNGEIVRLAPDPAQIIDQAPVGRLFRDGNLLVPAEDSPVRERRSLAYAGIVVVALARSGRGNVSPDAEIVLDGVPQSDAEGRPMLEIVRRTIEGTIASIPRDRQKDGEMVREAVRRAVRAAVDDAWGKRPVVKVLLTRGG
jgi:ribonuclease J